MLKRFFLLLKPSPAGRVSMEQMTFGDTVLTQQLFGEAISMPDEFQNIPFSAQYLVCWPPLNTPS